MIRAANIWCLVVLLALLALLVALTLMTARQSRRHHRTPGFPAGQFPLRHVAAAAPLEALAALHSRLLDLHARLPQGSEDARWLNWFVGRLRSVMDEAYTWLEAAPPHLEARLLDRLAVEVEALAGVVNLQLSARLAEGTDRQALEEQLDALRAILRS